MNAELTQAVIMSNLILLRWREMNKHQLMNFDDVKGMVIHTILKFLKPQIPSTRHHWEVKQLRKAIAECLMLERNEDFTVKRITLLIHDRLGLNTNNSLVLKQISDTLNGLDYAYCKAKAFDTRLPESLSQTSSSGGFDLSILNQIKFA